VCADGSSSFGRSLLVPNSTSNYVGYILWRGLLEESQLPNHLCDYFLKPQALHLFEGKNCQFVAYGVPGKGGNISVGHRRLNWGW
jgi:hypothetical protein